AASRENSILDPIPSRPPAFSSSSLLVFRSCSGAAATRPGGVAMALSDSLEDWKEGRREGEIRDRSNPFWSSGRVREPPQPLSGGQSRGGSTSARGCRRVGRRSIPLRETNPSAREED